VVWVPFPFVEQPRLRLRPALVVGTWLGHAGEQLIWTLMITSAENSGWADDIDLSRRFKECGLPSPSVIRTAKISTNEARTAIKLGRLPEDLHVQAMAKVRTRLGF
jgi:mRNA interferase MazF